MGQEFTVVQAVTHTGRCLPLVLEVWRNFWKQEELEELSQTTGSGSGMVAKLALKYG